ncbi:hypothetical protein FN846DRAFT_954240 [Sphaerosporella brunnea]|uniref:Uncharacterized protein n=1 Tax=Sphaerosporella brunnea TaxID=1250544 RepID=A0A5J5EU27_9PEZI|nr:hypothetical protein FN846DRAFT_954240 [Sphaerosporella brunnea]
MRALFSSIARKGRGCWRTPQAWSNIPAPSKTIEGHLAGVRDDRTQTRLQHEHTLRAVEEVGAMMELIIWAMQHCDWAAGTVTCRIARVFDGVNRLCSLSQKPNVRRHIPLRQRISLKTLKRFYRPFLGCQELRRGMGGHGRTRRRLSRNDHCLPAN